MLPVALSPSLFRLSGSCYTPSSWWNTTWCLERGVQYYGMSWVRRKRGSGRHTCQHCPSSGWDSYVTEKKKKRKKSELHSLCIPRIIIITSSALLSHFNMLPLSHIHCFPLHVQWVAVCDHRHVQGLQMLWFLANKTKYTCLLPGWTVRLFHHIQRPIFLYYIPLHAISSFYKTIVEQRSVCGRAHETHRVLL